MTFLAQLDRFDTTGLDPLQRILLVSDGTLTDILEAAFAEPIHVDKLSSQIRSIEWPQPDLDAPALASFLDRKVLLRGSVSGRTFLYAESQILLDRLPQGFRESLVQSDTALGRLWLQYKIETRKELLAITRIADSSLSRHFPGPEGATLLKRAYRVISGGRPIMRITEYFPERYQHRAV